MKQFCLKAGEGKHTVEAVAVICGPDISVSICGGTHYHIGASALGIPRPSLRDPSRISASVSVLTAVGHMEDELAKQVSHNLASAFNCRVAVTAGLHIDNATKEDIQLLCDHCESVVQEMGTLLKGEYPWSQK